MNQVVTILCEAYQEKYWTEKNKPLMAQAVRHLSQNATNEFQAACAQASVTQEHRARLEQANSFMP